MADSHGSAGRRSTARTALVALTRFVLGALGGHSLRARERPPQCDVSIELTQELASLRTEIDSIRRVVEGASPSLSTPSFDAFERRGHDFRGRDHEVGMRLDLGGIGKGYACLRAIAAVADAGVMSALVQMGGDLACSAPPPARAGWEIDVGGEIHRVHDCAVATSGDTEQHLDIDGVRYSHVVDPRTGLGLVGGIEVTIQAADGATADALATAATQMSAPAFERAAVGFGARVLRSTEPRR